MDFASRLRHWRTTKKLTKAGLARLIDVTRAAVCHWESGAAEPTIDHQEAIAKALGISLAVFWAPVAKRKAAA